MRIMIVEDDSIISKSIKEELARWGYDVYCVENFNEIMESFNSINPQLVLLDIMLPYFNGYYWCQEIRKVSNVPIIFISSKSENMDIVMAIQFGGDDYITKPINMDVAIAKIKAILRRTYNFTNEMDYLRFERVSLNISECRIIYSNKDAELTKTEMLISEALFKEQGAVATREKIMDKCWQNDNFIDDNTLAVNIARLRKKLKKIGLDGFIETKKGSGYFLSKNGEWSVNEE